MLTLFPFHWVSDYVKGTRLRYIFLLKILRLERASDLITVRKVTNYAQAYLRERTKQLMIDDPITACNSHIDHNRIGLVIMLGATLKILKNIIVFISLAYFGGILWLIWCDISYEYIVTE